MQEHDMCCCCVVVKIAGEIVVSAFATSQLRTVSNLYGTCCILILDALEYCYYRLHEL